MKDCNRPTRAILNFAHKCALNCEWCYVPFEAPAVQQDSINAVVYRIVELGFSEITIGGGDPFQYPYLVYLLRLAKSLGLVVHVDTHGRGFRNSIENRELMEDTIDLLGLPLDGSSPAVHDSMRSSPGHFSLVQKRMHWLGPLRKQLKINTILSAVNVHDLLDLARLIGKWEPVRWSIYQYWPLGPAGAVDLKHSIQEDEFLSATEHVRSILSHCHTKVEINTRESRRDTYPIVHHDGNVFVHAEFPSNEFLSLGSIFDVNILDRILSCCSVDRKDATSRYR